MPTCERWRRDDRVSRAPSRAGLRDGGGPPMLPEDVGSLPVVDGEELVGMVTDRDLVINVLAKDLDPNKTQVAEVCSEEPVSAEPASRSRKRWR